MTNPKHLIGIDLGGTDIKGGIISRNGEIVAISTIPTQSTDGPEAVISRIGDQVEQLLAEANLTLADTSGIGIGIPGMIDSSLGVVVYNNNLGWNNVPIVDLLRARFDTRVAITNDANAAALGEAMFGAGKNYRDSIMLTLGTGVGGGIVIGGKLFEGNHSAGAEIGHMIINKDGPQCTCGLRGCLETYTSATALINATRVQLEMHSDSAMWSAITNLNQVNAKLPWDFVDTDPLASIIISQYLEYLAIGIVNLINIFRPEAIIIGGGVSRQGENLTKRLRPLVAPMIYGGELGPSVDIVSATLSNSAGLFGAALLTECGTNS